MPVPNIEFDAFPFAEIIGAPLKAACDAQVIMAKSTGDFIREIGFMDYESGNPQTRMADFSFTRPVQNKDGIIIEEKVDLQVPMLAIVSIPNLSIRKIDVVFDVEIKRLSSRYHRTNDNSDTSGLQIFGKVSAHKEHTRSTDTSSKYHVEVSARSESVPEGLARVLDIMATSVAPRKIEPIPMK